MEIKDIVQKAHDNAVKHGFWDPPLPFGTAIALIHSELSEALEEERAGNSLVYYPNMGVNAGKPSWAFTRPTGTPWKRAANES